MARGKQIYLNYAALVLLGYASTAAADDLWKVDIDLSPAPPPELGPPFSAHASRDPAYLPYQILGIVGSYFVVVLFIGTLLLSCGQRARKRAQTMAQVHMGEEMVRPLKTYFDPSPISPQDAKSWYSPGRLRNKKSATASVKSLNSTKSPGNESVASFDAGVIEADKLKRAEQMEKLYAAVMAQDERRSQASGLRSPTTNPPEYTQRPNPTDAPSLRYLQHDQYPTSPRSPVRAIYPPDGAFATLNQSTGRYSSSSGSAERLSAGSQPSITSSSSKKARRSLKHLKISAPMHIEDNDDGARTPLSPRVYTDPGIPPEPPTARTVDTYDSTLWPTTPGTARSYAPDDWPHAEEEEVEKEQDEIHDLPATYSQRSGRGKAKLNFSQPLRLDVPQQSNPGTTNALPFRQLHWNTPTSPMYPYQGQGPFSAGPTKTTFVEVRRERIGAAPLTGMATPYSAYMPFTPLTPVTPHLTTRAERKQRQREQRTIQGAITEEDQVVDDRELWDEGY